MPQIQVSSPPRILLFTGLAAAAALAVAAVFYFFSHNAPTPGAANADAPAATVQVTQQPMRRSDIDRLIEERNALAPKPGNISRAQDAFKESRDSPEAPNSHAVKSYKASEQATDMEGAFGRAIVCLDARNCDGIDPKRAVEIVRLAASKGIAEAQYSYAGLLEAGDIISQNRIEALKFYLLAEEQGFGTYILPETGAYDATPVDRLRMTLTPAEVHDAEQRATAFKPVRD